MKLKSLPALFAVALAIGVSPVHAQTLPSDAKSTCTVPAATFKTWFQSGSVAVNGVVNPANSATFSPNSLCSFYQWSEQMFLWLTSPAPSEYGGGPRIFDSGVFYDVTPPDSSGNRSFVQHTEKGRTIAFPVRAAQLGPHGLPIVRDTAGVFHEVELPKISAKGNQIIHDASGKPIEIGRASVGADGKPVLLDTAGKAINLSSLIRRPLQIRGSAAVLSTTLQRISINGSLFFLGSGGSIVPVEQEEAEDGDVLESQHGSLIYYATIVNDVYAYFRTRVKDNNINPSSFPTNAAQLAPIVALAAAHSKTFPDPNALTVEIKSSWVEAAGLPNLSSYITVEGTIPTYNTTNKNKWIPTGTKTVQLALLGMHVVGSVNGHPEMVWATFEHTGNTPLAAYSYTSTSGASKTVGQSTSGTWLFSKTGSTGPFNKPHMQQAGGSADITSVSPFTISPSDTIRWTPFGGLANAAGTTSNTDILSINNSVRGQLTSADIRSNYIMSGAVWTHNGASPTGTNLLGTTQLTNSTMETYQQGANNTSASVTCLACHAANTTATSHVFSALKPLF